mgnify:CR=1 FL=1
MKNRLIFLMAASFAMVLGACDRPVSEETPERLAEAATTQGLESQADSSTAMAGAETKMILVAGATGTQGGAVARELLNRGYRVRAFTRNPDSTRAQALTELGAELVQGNFNDAESIATAMDGAYGVFAVTLFWSEGYDGEVEQGERLIDEAVKAGVEHFVLTSVAGADQSTGIPHFDSKWEVEQYLHQSSLNWTIVRPVEFMDNWHWSVEQFTAGRLVDPRSPDSSHQWIAASDIGFFVAEAFDTPGHWIGLTQEIAGDQHTVGELAGLLSEAFGKDISHEQIAWEAYESEAGEEVTIMYRWFEDDGSSVDIAALRERYTELVTVKDFLAGLVATPSEPEPEG